MDSVVRRCGDVEDLGLHLVDRPLDVFGHAVADVGDLTGHADHPAQERVLFDDARA